MNLRYACLWLVLICIGLPTSSGRTASFEETSNPISRVVRQAGDDRIIFGTDEDDDQNLDSYLRNYSEKEKECLSRKQLLVNEKCYSLSTTGPCAKNEWLVLDSSSSGDNLKAICEKKRCTENNEIWWPSLSKCIVKSLAKSQYCQGVGKEIKINPFGEGVCACGDDYGSLEGSEQCHEYYQQGPCRNRKVLTYDILTGNAVCSFDKCYRENVKSVSKRSITERDLHHITHYKDTNKLSFRNMDESEMFGSRGQINEKRFKRATEPARKLYAPLEGDGPCHKLGSASPCPENKTQSRFVVDKITHVPRCSIANLELQLIKPASLCIVDGGNNCKDSIKIENKNAVSQTLLFKKQLEQRRQK